MSNATRQTRKNQQSTAGQIKSAVQREKWINLRYIIAKQLAMFQMYAAGMAELSTMDIGIIRCIENQAEVTANIQLLTKDAERIRTALQQVDANLNVLGDLDREVREDEMMDYLNVVTSISQLSQDQMTLCDPVFASIDQAVRKARVAYAAQQAAGQVETAAEPVADIVDAELVPQ